MVKGWQAGSMAEWEDSRRERGRREAGGKDGERENFYLTFKVKQYTTIPSRGLAQGKLRLDRPHQGAAMLC